MGSCYMYTEWESFCSSWQILLIVRYWCALLYSVVIGSMWSCYDLGWNLYILDGDTVMFFLNEQNVLYTVTCRHTCALPVMNELNKCFWTFLCKFLNTCSSMKSTCPGMGLYITLDTEIGIDGRSVASILIALHGSKHACMSTTCSHTGVLYTVQFMYRRPC